MTKEEYIGKYPIVCNNTGTKLYLDRDDVLKAMGLFSKQQAIAFAIDYARRVLTWIDVNHMKPEDVANDRMEERYAHFIENKFIEQQNKTNVE